jgi:hypothetical protein
MGMASSWAPAASISSRTTLFHLAQYPQAQGHPAVKARGEFADEAGPQHEPVADDFRVGRGFLVGGDEKLAAAHRGLSSLQWLAAAVYGGTGSRYSWRRSKNAADVWKNRVFLESIPL